MNPTQEQLTQFQEQYYPGGAFLDIAPNLLDDRSWLVGLHDDNGNEIDSVTFDDEATARRYIDWLVDNSVEIDAIQSREFVL